jgi:hypothetical protein
MEPATFSTVDLCRGLSLDYHGGDDVVCALGNLRRVNQLRLDAPRTRERQSGIFAMVTKAGLKDLSAGVMRQRCWIWSAEGITYRP